MTQCLGRHVISHYTQQSKNTYIQRLKWKVIIVFQQYSFARSYIVQWKGAQFGGYDSFDEMAVVNS